MTTTTETATTGSSGTVRIRLQRLHHLAYTTYDMAATRHFYEDLIGMPLAQTWIEAPTEGPLAGRSYVHCFYGLADGGAIVYFEYHGDRAPEHRRPGEGHLALKTDADAQRGIHDRLIEDGYREEDLRFIDHGYCQSLYVTDPNGLRLEFTVDVEEINQIVDYQAATARDELARWQRGDRTPNNSWRPEGT